MIMRLKLPAAAAAKAAAIAGITPASNTGGKIEHRKTAPETAWILALRYLFLYVQMACFVSALHIQ